MGTHTHVRWGNFFKDLTVDLQEKSGQHPKATKGLRGLTPRHSTNSEPPGGADSSFRDPSYAHAQSAPTRSMRTRAHYSIPDVRAEASANSLCLLLESGSGDMRTRAPPDVRAHTQTCAYPRPPLTTCAGPAFPARRHVRTAPPAIGASAGRAPKFPRAAVSCPFLVTVTQHLLWGSRKSIACTTPHKFPSTQAPELPPPSPRTSLRPCRGHPLVSRSCLDPWPAARIKAWLKSTLKSTWGQTILLKALEVARHWGRVFWTF